MYPIALSEARHRLLEGFVLRLARHPDADAFVLRGGMLVRQWFPSIGRSALDLDLACALPFEPAALRSRLEAVLADTSVADSVIFYPERSRVDAIWADTAAPGLRMSALGQVDGCTLDLRVDVTFGLRLWPAPSQGLYEALRGTARLWMCQPASLIGRKLQVIAGLGHLHWRPKDLNDVRLMLARFPLEQSALGEAIEASLVGCAETMEDVREAFTHASWWGGPRASGRWHRYLDESWQGTDDRAEPAAPDDLASAVAEVRSHLRPLLLVTS